MRLVIAGVLLLALAAAAQQPRQTTGQDTQAGKIAVNVQLIVETVVVKDKQGKPVEGLTAKDFTITENGVPQAISFCERAQLPETLSEPATPSKPDEVKIYNQLART